MQVNIVEVLDAPRDYYVHPQDGDDNNDGLTAATAFATAQKGVNVAQSLISAAQPITVNLLSGDYTGQSITVNPMLCGPDWMLTINGASGVVIEESLIANCAIQNLKVNGALKMASGICYAMSVSAKRFEADRLAYADLMSCKRYGAAGLHAIKATGLSRVSVSGLVIEDSPTLDEATVVADEGSVVKFFDQPTGTVTGRRYIVRENAVIKGTDGNESFIPGDEVGDTESGGVYA